MTLKPTAGTALIGVLVYKEPATALRLFFIAALIGPIIGLKFANQVEFALEQ